ncbi:hypothetical protein LQZ19_08520 [Treponema primitia]|uniref:hypothetical protein n=1 Tax=Treponema primitia TaxID=88058 RepID=UPI0039803652
MPKTDDELFREKVAEMRDTQKKYFKSRSYTIEKEKFLAESKRLESEVDAILTAWKHEEARKNNPELFD